VAVVAAEEDGTEHLVAMLGPGQLLGFTSFSRQAPHTRAARAASDAVVFKLNRAAYDAAVGEVAEAR
jgi:CRP-like cAMP-binding protein